MDILDELAAGREITSPHNTRAKGSVERANHAMELSYTLAKCVPCMESGFSISTSYGDIPIGGELAQRIQALVAEALRAEIDKTMGAV